MQNYLERFNSYLIKINLRDIDQLADLIIKTATNGSHIFVAGNGGSASTASHMMTDLLGLGIKNNFRIRVTCLSDNSSVVTALANDYDYAQVFSKQLNIFGKKGDLLIVISASGNSPNLVSALNEAKRVGMSSCAILGFDGGEIKDIVSNYILVKTDLGDYGPAEDIHLIINHMLKEEIVNILNAKNLDAREI